MVFAIAGSACIYLIGPFVDDLLNKLPAKVKLILATVLLACFGADLYYSHYHPNTGDGITDYGYTDDDSIVGMDPGEFRLTDTGTCSGRASLTAGIGYEDIPRLN